MVFNITERGSEYGGRPDCVAAAVSEGTDSRYVSKQQLFVYTWRGEWLKDGGRERGREGE